MAVYTVIKTIGTTSRQYSTLQAWEDAAPANLTTAEKSACSTFSGNFTIGETITFVGSGATGKLLETDNSSYLVYGITTGNPATSDVATGGTSLKTCILTSGTPDNVGVIWQGEAYNDSEFTADLVISGSTTSATCYKHLTVASGQSFQDNANVRTNALTYNRSNGVGVNFGSSYRAFTVSGENYARLSRFQIKCSAASNYIYAFDVVKDCILQASAGRTGNTGSVYSCLNNINVLVILNCATGNAFKAGICTNCTAIRTTNYSASGESFHVGLYASCVMRNCASFGFQYINNGTPEVSSSSSYNATDLASGIPGTNNQHSVTYSSTTPFTLATNTNCNLIPIAGTSLIGNGSKDVTNAPSDITGTARATACTIGVWELASAASGPANLKSRSGNLKANIKSLSGNLIANCKSLSGDS